MSNESNDIITVSSLIRKDFGFDTNELTDHNLLEELKHQLTFIISYLLDKDFERLMQAMYRIDINESKFKGALNINPPTDVAPAIAQLIIEREMQKVETRKKYRQ